LRSLLLPFCLLSLHGFVNNFRAVVSELRAERVSAVHVLPAKNLVLSGDAARSLGRDCRNQALRDIAAAFGVCVSKHSVAWRLGKIPLALKLA
jgi:hypothetical protein